MRAMRRGDFYFELPAELIAQHPAAQRSASRLLCLDRDGGAILDKQFSDLSDYLQAGDMLVLNNTKVIPARLFATKQTGGKVEILLERVLDEKRVLAQVRASKAPREQMLLHIAADIQFRVEGRLQDMYELTLQSELSLMQVLQAHGHIPLPPYIDRSDQSMDHERYQTVYASIPGAVAAPTAGLHFDRDLLARIERSGIAIEYITLHVGAGTFSPVRVENLDQHKMHSEYIELSPLVCERIKQAKASGGRIIAVGTTTVRCLESAYRMGDLSPYAGETDIFIRPGYEFHVVDGLVTNFHLPESSLLMLVSAFAGTASVLNAYRHAIAEKYRFYSYGDAMFIINDLAGTR